MLQDVQYCLLSFICVLPPQLGQTQNCVVSGFCGLDGMVDFTTVFFIFKNTVMTTTATTIIPIPRMMNSIETLGALDVDGWIEFAEGVGVNTF